MYFSGIGIDRDLCHLTTEHVGLPGIALAGFRIKRLMMCRKGSATDRHYAPDLFANVNRVFQGQVESGMAFYINPAVSHLNALDVHIPVISNYPQEFCFDVQAGVVDCVANHVGLPARTGVGRFRRTRGIIVADRHVFRIHAEHLGRNLGKDCENTFSDFRHARQNHCRSAVVNLNERRGLIPRGRTGNGVPGGTNTAPIAEP